MWNSCRETYQELSEPKILFVYYTYRVYNLSIDTRVQIIGERWYIPSFSLDGEYQLAANLVFEVTGGCCYNRLWYGHRLATRAVCGALQPLKEHRGVPKGSLSLGMWRWVRSSHLWYVARELKSSVECPTHLPFLLSSSYSIVRAGGWGYRYSNHTHIY